MNRDRLRFFAAVVLLQSTGIVFACRAHVGDDELQSDFVDSEGDGGKPDAGGGVSDTDTLDGGLTSDDADTDDETNTDTAMPKKLCEALSVLHETLFCADSISDEATFDALAAPGFGTDRVAQTKYVMGADSELNVPLAFMNVNIHRLHYDFLAAAFPEVFQDISPVAYLDMAMDGETRRLFVGSIALYVSGDERFYGFTILDDGGAPEKVIRFEQAKRVYDEMSSHFSIGTLRFVPETAAQIEATQSWPSLFPISDVGI